MFLKWLDQSLEKHRLVVKNPEKGFGLALAGVGWFLQVWLVWAGLAGLAGFG